MVIYITTPTPPVCIEGRNACPPENIGGIHGYCEALKEGKNRYLDEDDIEMTFGDEKFNSEELDIEYANEELKYLFSVPETTSEKIDELPPKSTKRYRTA